MSLNTQAQSVHILFGIKWFGFTDLFGSACLFGAGKKGGKKKVWQKKVVTLSL
jgi:hypothetical protein